MGILDWLFPKNYVPDEHVPAYNTDSQMASTKNSMVGYLDRSGKYNRAHGNVDVGKFREERLKAEQGAVRRDWARKAAAANEAELNIALRLAYHPEELRWYNEKLPSKEVMQAAKEYAAKHK